MHDCDRQPTPADGVGTTEVRLGLPDVAGVESAHEIHEAACRVATVGGDVRVPCAHVEHLDASAIQILLALERELRGHARRLLLDATTPGVAADLRLAGVERWLGGVE